MKKEFIITGISCMSCVSKIEKTLYSSIDIKKVSIDKNSGQTIIEGDPIPKDSIIQGLLSEAGNYALTQNTKTHFLTPYKPLLIILGYLLAVTLSIAFSSGKFDIHSWMGNFMAGFFLVFSFFKLLDVAAFANAYQSYDIIASKFKIYGYVYPFIELLLGFAYLFFYDYTITNSITAIIMFVSIIGVIRSVLSKSEIQCACLGTVFNLPMSYVTIIEDAIMLIMALFMLF